MDKYCSNVTDFSTDSPKFDNSMGAGESTIKICPLCNAAFTCSPVDCWCSMLPPVMPLLPEAECYCPACLKEKIDLSPAYRQAGQPSPTTFAKATVVEKGEGGGL